MSVHSNKLFIPNITAIDSRTQLVKPLGQGLNMPKLVVVVL